MKKTIFIIFALALAIPTCAISAEKKKTIIIGEKHTTQTKSLKASANNTRVIELVGKKTRGKKSRGQSICSEFGKRFYCKQVGKEAVESATSEELGKITGVIWRDEGKAVSAYLPEGWLNLDADEEILKLNMAVKTEGFYYIVQSGKKRPFMIECTRITPKT